jgi:hypothetical protein
VDRKPLGPNAVRVQLELSKDGTPIIHFEDGLNARVSAWVSAATVARAIRKDPATELWMREIAREEVHKARHWTTEEVRALFSANGIIG